MKQLPTLEEVTAQLKAQDAELAACFEDLRGLDPDLEIGVSQEWMAGLSSEVSVAPPIPEPAPWAIRA